MEFISIWLQTYLGINPAAQQKIITSFLIVIVLSVIHRLLLINVIQRIKDLDRHYQWQKSLSYTVSILGVVTISLVWIEGIQSAATYLGLVTAGLAISLKDPITNVVAWGFILWRKPFEVGDRIEIGAYTGDVVDQRIFQFSMMEIGNWVDADQSTGRILHIPNGIVFTQTVANFTHGPNYLWNEIPVLITFESNWEKAKKILQKISDEYDVIHNIDAEKEFEVAAQKLLLKHDNLKSVVYTSVLESGILLTIRYLCKPRHRRTTSEILWEDTLRAFAKHADIALAYPTTRFYTVPTDNKN